jgi:hypothetical protein
MKAIPSLAAGTSILALLAVLLSNCEGPQGPQGTTLPTIQGSIHIYESPGFSPNVSVSVKNVPEVPSVTINGVQVPLDLNPTGSFNFHQFGFPISKGDLAELLVTFVKLDGTSGVAQAEVTVPGDFEITSHDPDTSLAVSTGDSLTFTWTSSEAADAYWVDFYIHYHYESITGPNVLFSYNIDTTWTDTTITFTTATLFPDLDEIESIIPRSGGWFKLRAVAGPWLEGDLGNVAGDGIGIFYAKTATKGISLYCAD